jgi:hypothetical protein
MSTNKDANYLAGSPTISINCIDGKAKQQNNDLIISVVILPIIRVKPKLKKI